VQRVLDRDERAVRLALDDRVEELVEGRARQHLDVRSERQQRRLVAERPALALDRHL